MTAVSTWGERTRPSWERLLCLGPLLASAALIIGVNTIALGIRLSRGFPVNPWESGFMLEAFRLNHGLPTLTAPEADHATTMYGILHPVWLAAATRLFGLEFAVLRAVSLVAAAALTLILARAFGWNVPRHTRFVALACLFGVNFPILSYFVDTRPDVMALLLAALGLIAMHRGLPRHQPGWLVLGTVLLLLAVFTKQTMLAFAFVPLVVTLADREQRRRPARLLAALAPPLTVGLAILALRSWMPLGLAYMFTIPAQYPVHPSLLWTRLVALLPYVAVALPLIAWNSGERLPRASSKEGWLLAAAVLALPASLVPAAKFGGRHNSFLPFVMCVNAFVASRLGPLVKDSLDPRPSLLSRVGLPWLTAVLLLISTFQDWRQAWYWAASIRFGDERYTQTIEAIRSLPAGRVLSPSDPTLVLRAHGTPGRCLTLERDASGWRSPIPPYVIAEIRNADWLVLVNTTWHDGLDSSLAEQLGFRRADGYLPQSTVYQLYRKATPSTD